MLRTNCHAHSEPASHQQELGHGCNMLYAYQRLQVKWSAKQHVDSSSLNTRAGVVNQSGRMRNVGLHLETD